MNKTLSLDHLFEWDHIATTLALRFSGLSFSLLLLCTIAAGAQEQASLWNIQVGPAVETNDRVLERNGKTLLWGGPDESQHFDISVFRLEAARLRYGIGRERFPALIRPEFVSAAEANVWLADSARVLLFCIGAEARVYPLQLLIRHELINDVVAGRPVMAAYCILAGLGAVYDRVIDGRTYTFALSGYTYSDPLVWDGLDAFVLWDRETESLWWPPAGKAVSGLMIDTPMKVLKHELWSQTTWRAAKTRFSDLRVLQKDQTMSPPATWPRYTSPPAAPPARYDTPPDAIAPRWGHNAGLPDSASSAVRSVD